MRLIAFMLLCFSSMLAHAEVMDKEFSLQTIIIFSTVSAASVFFVAKYRSKWIFLVAPIIGFFLWAHLAELLDPYVGDAIASEAGKIYIFISWMSPVLILTAGLVGLLVGRRR